MHSVNYTLLERYLLAWETEDVAGLVALSGEWLSLCKLRVNRPYQSRNCSAA